MRVHHIFIAMSLIAAASACTAGQDKIPHARPVPEAAPDELADPMASFAHMMPGQWQMTFQGGTSIYDTWHWGPGRHSMRVMTDGFGADGEPWRELDVMYWHPGREQVRLLHMHRDVPGIGRGVGEGTIKFDSDAAEVVYDLYQPGVRRKLGSRWTFDGSDRYHEILSESTGPGGFQPLVEWDRVRVNRRSEPPPPIAEEALTPSKNLKVFEPLLGHTWEAKGAYTDAKSQRSGLFVQAQGGTLFLDEIGSMPVSVQPKLLRALQDRRVRPVGSDNEMEVDVRIVSATNRDLESAIAEGRFRDDLYFRINVIHVDLPPLRSRGNDVLVLAQQFVREFAARASKEIVGLSAAAAQKLLTYAWPGNVRELQNCIERAVALSCCDHLTVDDLPEKVRNYATSHVLVVADDPTELATMEEVERRYILRVLEAVQGNKTVAARILGFDRTTLYRKLERYSPDGSPPWGEPGKAS